MVAGCYDGERTVNEIRIGTRTMAPILSMDAAEGVDPTQNEIIGRNLEGIEPIILFQV